MYWGVDPFILDAVDPCCCVFLRLEPRVYGAVMITR